MLTIYLQKNYNTSLNLKKSKSRIIINYIKIILILYLIDANILINTLIVKKSKVFVYKSIFRLY